MRECNEQSKELFEERTVQVILRKIQKNDSYLPAIKLKSHRSWLPLPRECHMVIISSVSVHSSFGVGATVCWSQQKNPHTTRLQGLYRLLVTQQPSWLMEEEEEDVVQIHDGPSSSVADLYRLTNKSVAYICFQNQTSVSGL